MNLEKRIKAFVTLGLQMRADAVNSESEFGKATITAQYANPWFTPENVVEAVNAIALEWLTNPEIEKWINGYPKNYFETKSPKRVGVVMAGNIPLVGFHDFLCVLITGNAINMKLSSKDGGLMQAIANMLINIEPEFKPLIQIADGPLKEFDAVLATGSDSSVRYFDYYFRNYPSLIRGHRNGIAILRGNETQDDLVGLSNDIFTYFGLGCRNVSKLLVPVGYNFDSLIRSMNRWEHLINHHRYANNYEYNRTILLLNQSPHLDTGFAMLVANENIDAHVATINFQEYSSLKAALEYLKLHDDKIQCVACAEEIEHQRRVHFGQTQKPKLNDYADGVDTIQFLASL